MKRYLIAMLFLPSVCCAQQYPNTVCVYASPSVDTSAYESGDLIGGKLTFAGALRAATSSGYVVSATVFDQAAQAVDLELVLFGSDPTATTFTDQAALDVADADTFKVASAVSFGSASRFAWADNGMKYVSEIMRPVVGASTSLYGALVSRGTPTFATSADVRVQVCVSQD